MHRRTPTDRPLSTRSPRTLLPLALFAALATAATGCKKEEDSVDPDAAADTQDTPEPEPAGPTYPEQGPDPAELQQAQQMFLVGQYAEVVELMTPIADGMLEDGQIRARGIAAALQGMAAAQDIAEKGHVPAELAVEQAGRLDDAELTQYAAAAMAVYHLGVQEYAKAEAELREVVETSSSLQPLVRLLLAESVLGQAFEDDKLTHPEKLDAAAEIYQSVWDAGEADIIKGRAADGLTAVGYYKKDKDMTCEWSAQASTLYESAGASDYMKEGPRGPADALRCAN